MSRTENPHVSIAAGGTVRRGGRRVAVITGTSATTMLLVGVMIVVATGFTPARSRLLDGGAWLADTENMPHASGPNVAVDAAVQRCPDPSDCRWAQRDGLAYLLQSGSGQVYRLDTSTRAFDEQGVSIGAPGARLLVGTGRVYSVERNEVTARDPVSLAPRHNAVRLQGAAGDALVDRSGILWVVAQGTGTLVGVEDGEVVQTISAGMPSAELVLGSIDDTPVVFDRETGTIVPLDDRGRELARLTLTGFDSRRVTLGRDLPAGPLAIIESGSGRIAKVTLGSGQLDELGQIDVGDDVGALYEVGRSVFVAQPNQRRVQWFSTDDRVVHEPIGDATEVFVKDGYLFANDAEASEAHIAGPDSDPQPVLKRRGDIPKFEVKPNQNTYDPTPVSVTTTTEPGADEDADESTDSTSSTSSTTSTQPPSSSTTLPASELPPRPPTNVQGQGADGQATVSWNTSSEPIDHFEIDPTTDSAPFNLQAAPASACKGGDCSVVIKPLANDNTYKFVLFAVSRSGARSGPSQPSPPTLVAAGLPGNPGVPTAKGKANGVVEVSWAAAGRGPGGRPITGYAVTVLDSTKQNAINTVRATSTNKDIPGLTNGQDYHFRVVAQNDAGKESSAVDTQQPAGPFGAPDPLRVSGRSTTCNTTPDASIQWGIDWQGYSPEPDSTVNEVQITLNGLPWPPSSGNGATVTIAAGRISTVEVLAKNDAGSSLQPGSATTTCYLDDPTDVLSLSLDTSQADMVRVSLQNTLRPTGSDPPTAGSECCYIRLSQPVIQVIAPDSTVFKTINVASPLSPGEGASDDVSTAGLTSGRYKVRLSSTNGTLEATFEIAGTSTTTAASIRTGSASSNTGAADIDLDGRRDVSGSLPAKGVIRGARTPYVYRRRSS